MSNRVDGTMTSLHLGMDYVNKILNLYPTNTTYKFLTNDFAPFSNTLKSKDEIEELLTELRLSNISRTLDESYSRLNNKTQLQTDLNNDIFVISDFQKSTSGDLSLLNIDSLDQVFMTPIQFEATKNVFVDTVYLSNPFLMANEKNRLNVVLKNTGFEEANDFPIKLFINEIQTTSTIVSIPAGGSRELNFEINYNLEKVNRCRINFEDYPVIFDNDFYFVLKLENKINILEIKNDDAVTPIEQVYGNKSLFNYKSQVASNTDYSLIRQYELVVVSGLQSIDNSLSLELNNYIDQGGSLLIIPGAHPDLNSYRNLLGSISNVPNDTSRVDISMPDLSDPFYENIFESSSERIEMPAALPILSWRGQQIDLLKLKNNLNFLSGFKKAGTVFILAAPLTDQYTNFHRHALFVPVMYRMAALSKRSFENPYYSINEPLIILKLDSLNKQDIFKLVDDEDELIPNQRISANELFLELPKNTLNPGFYDLRLDQKIKAVLAFNLEKSESDLGQLSKEDISAYFGTYKNVTIFDTNDADNFSKEVKKNKFGVPLWKYAIIMSLLFLLAEVLLIRFL